MISSPNPSHQEALKVIQQAVWDLASWAGLKFDKFTRPNDSAVIEEAKKYLNWSADDKPKALRVLFDSVKLAQGQNNEHFWQPNAIANSDPIIPYPQTQEPQDIEDLKKKIDSKISFLKDNQEDWNNLSLLTLILEKFGSFISYCEENVALAGLRQKLGPNIAQTGFVSSKYVTIKSKPIKKAKRHSCSEGF